MVLPEKLDVVIKFGFCNESAEVFVSMHEDLLGFALARIAKSESPIGEVPPLLRQKCKSATFSYFCVGQIRNKCKSATVYQQNPLK